MRGLPDLLQAMADRDRERFSRALACLPERNRAVVQAALSGESQTTTAASLGVSQPAVSSMLRSSIAAISEVLSVD